MTRGENEPVSDWHARATAAYFRLVTEVAAERGTHPDGSDAPDPELSEAFADWYAAAKALHAEKTTGGESDLSF